jgi:hypothetical protein
MPAENSATYMSLEWRGAAVEPGSGVPSATTWQDVDVPGRPVKFAGDDAVAYRTEFADPREADDEHAVLVLEGVFAHARVWLNGDELAEHDAYFDPLRVSLPVEDENELIVECRAPEDRFGGIYDTDRVPANASVPGIWWGATIETHPDPYVESLSVAPRVGDGEPTVAVEATVVTDQPLDDRMTLSIRPEGDVRGGGMMNRAAVETEPGRVTVTHDVEVRDGSLWWPHDLGDQPRYALRAKLADSERTTVTGLRSVDYDEDGLLVNGERVAARGVNLTDATAADVERAVRANANLVRAHAHVLSPEVYEACDEQGVLVWQDLPLTGPGEFDVERGQDLAERLVRARRNRPSLAAVSVHDEPTPDFGDGLGTGAVDRLRYRWRAWRASYDRGPADSVADAVSEVPTFPVVGPAGVGPDAATIYPGWTFGEAGDVDWLCDRFGLGDVVAEFGAGALAADDPADETDFDAERHAARVGSGVDESQDYQADVLGTVAERLRLRGTNVLAAYALRDVGDAGMGVLARDGSEKTAFDRLAAAYQPVQGVLSDPTPGESDMVVVYDRPSPATVTVEWDVNGEREQDELKVGAYGRVDVTTLSLSAGDAVTIAVATDDGVAHNEYRI